MVRLDYDSGTGERIECGNVNKLIFRDILIVALLLLVITAVIRIDYLSSELANETLFSKYVRRELAEEQRRIPERCAEDVFLRGIGNFEAGQYQAYECGLAMDDFINPQIIGSVEFKQRVVSALELVRQAGYGEFVGKRVQTVRLIDRDSRMDVFTGEYRVTYVSSVAPGLEWFASTLVHEAQHVFQYETGASYFGAEAELDANAKQMEFLLAIDAPQMDINWLQSLSFQMAAGTLNTWDEPHEY